MAKIRVRRGTRAALLASTMVAGELGLATDSGDLYAFDGLTKVLIGSGKIQRGLYSARPAAGTLGTLYHASDRDVLYIDTGSSWARVSSPAGQISFFGMTSAPTGWLPCDGALVSRTTYSELFAAIGTSFGAGNGTTTFALPNAQCRFPLATGATAGLTTRTINAQGGEETHILSVDEMPAHNHGVVLSGGAVRGRTGSKNIYGSDTSGGLSGSAGSGAAHNTMPPFIALPMHIRF